jgi:hypothetical protein
MNFLLKELQTKLDSEKDSPMDARKRAIKDAGKMNPKKHIQDTVDNVCNDNIAQTLTSMVNSVAF